MKMTASDPSSTSVIHEQVFSRLRDALIAGQLEPGRSISVRGLAAEFGVSAMPAREAIRRLVAIGALEMTDTRRVSVARMTEEKLDQLLVARLALEPELARRACLAFQHRLKEKNRFLLSLKKIDFGLDRAIESDDATEYASLNSAFHLTLYRASNATLLLGLVESLWLQFGPFMRVVIGRVGTSLFDDDKHKAAIDAFEMGDCEALERAIRNDILQGMNTIKLGHS